MSRCAKCGNPQDRTPEQKKNTKDDFEQGLESVNKTEWCWSCIEAYYDAQEE